MNAKTIEHNKIILQNILVKHSRFLSPLLNKFFHIDSNVEQKLLRLKTTTCYKLTMPNLNFYEF
jgi:hypothetical protein